METEERWAMIEAERLSLADLLEGLTPERWEQQSLCSEWRVRDVAAHVAMTPQGLKLTPILVGVAKARGDLWAFGRDVARAHAERPVDVLVDELRRDAASRKMPAVTNAKNILLDAIVHGQDIAVPLGIEREVPAEAAAAGFERVWSMGWPFHARKRLRGLRLVATDAPVDVGDGAAVEGRVGDLLLLATGRTEAAVRRLTGPGLARLG
ncbi:maleylpyruvate isomerase family mycothiol-dependent enzyme [Nocardioides sp. HDW12B]|uniref:maleylpyruvate isomerase family mycothiol-dependent enzyme n=1 Tax=Nocardioides sp. HDW12B TaxID=2714939 RepID=UPI00140975BD|nr:maleylpyruvate isomerase family mycothiol-dependent enzyme [Nocardioides sp. HDW12B]QIK66256.1 maleylpyruvate isomerase family mycothiol-dependent enzyme [Nocardioides sp. HDW12B]